MIPLKQSLAIVDVETTGASAARGRIIEIAVVRIEPGKEPVSWATLVSPGRPVSDGVLELTGIRPEELDLAPDFEAVAHTVRDLLEGAVFVAHNVRFDYDFVRRELARAGIGFSAPKLCSVNLARRLFPDLRRHDLSSLIEHFGLETGRRHRALDDALAVYDFFCAAYRNNAARFLEGFEKGLAPGLRPVRIPGHVFDELPESPGVYVFYGAEREPLFVGSAARLRERVLGHFREDAGGARDEALAEKAVDLEVFRTAGGFSSALLEHRLAAELSPFFNRTLRRRKNAVYAVKEKGRGGYHKIVLRHAVGPEDLESRVLAVYPNKARALEALRETVSASGLCLRLAGLEKTRGACSGEASNACRGACTGKEPPESYNRRLASAFASPGIARWPFPSAVLIEEYCPLGRVSEVFVADQWKLISRSRAEEDAGEETFECEEGFDYGVYQVLRQAIRGDFRSVRIRLLPRENAEEKTDEGEAVIAMD